jgi:hypothetical protein
MIPPYLLDKNKEVKEMWSKLDRNNLKAFYDEFLVLSKDLLGKYVVAFPDDINLKDFYHVKKVIQEMDNFLSLPKENQADIFLEIRENADAALKDLEVIMNSNNPT